MIVINDFMKRMRIRMDKKAYVLSVNIVEPWFWMICYLLFVPRKLPAKYGTAGLSLAQHGADSSIFVLIWIFLNFPKRHKSKISFWVLYKMQVDSHEESLFNLWTPFSPQPAIAQIQSWCQKNCHVSSRGWCINKEILKIMLLMSSIFKKRFTENALITSRSKLLHILIRLCGLMVCV